MADPHQGALLLQRLRAKGVPAAQWDFTAASVGRLGAGLHLALRERRLVLPREEQLRDELLHVQLKKSVGGYRLDHDSDRHDDRAVPIALAIEALSEAAGGRAYVCVPQGVIPCPFRPATSFAEQAAAAAVTAWDYPRDFWPGRSNVWPARQQW